MWTDGFNAVNDKVEDLLVLYEFFEAKEATEEETTTEGEEALETTAFPVSTATVSTGGFKIIFKNAKIHAEKVIIKRDKTKR